MNNVGRVITRASIGLAITFIAVLLVAYFVPDPWWITACVGGAGLIITLITLIPTAQSQAAAAGDAGTAAAARSDESRISAWPLAFVILLIGIAVILLWKGGEIWDYAFGDDKPAMAAVKKEAVKIDAPTYPYLFYGEIKPGEIKQIKPRGPINVVFDDFTAPISFKWRQHDGSGSWTTLQPSQAGKTYHYALVHSTNRRHPQGLPLMIRANQRTHVTVRPF